VKRCDAEEFNSKQVDGQSGERDDSSNRQEGERATDAGGRTSTTTTAMTRTTTTTVSLPDDSGTASTSPSVTREPPIIVLQEAPVALRQDGFLDAAAAAIWIERQRTLHDPSRVTARPRVAADARTRSSSAAVPMSRRQRLNRRRRQPAVATAAAPEPWNDPLTGVLLCPEALEHIVVHSSIVPDTSTSAGPSGVAGAVHMAK